MSGSTGPDAATRAVVYQRAKEQCERCGSGVHLQIHHRLPRRMGGSKWPLINHPVNLVLLCGACHRQVESYRQQARDDHWLLGSEWSGTTDPGLIPVPRRRRVGGSGHAQRNRGDQASSPRPVESPSLVEGPDGQGTLPF